MFADDTVAWTCVGGRDRRMWVHHRLENTVCLSIGGESSN